MEITGRVTADATVKTVSGERQLVAFTVAQNESYKTKEGERKQVATYFDCSYWISTKVAEMLKKGTIVSLFGRLGVNAWTNMQGEPKATLTFHTNNIKFIGGGKTNAAAIKDDDVAPATTPEEADDLPF